LVGGRDGKIEKKRNTKKPEELLGLSQELPYQK
jgi:hypothetical protein